MVAQITSSGSENCPEKVGGCDRVVVSGGNVVACGLISPLCAQNELYNPNTTLQDAQTLLVAVLVRVWAHCGGLGLSFKIMVPRDNLHGCDVGHEWFSC